jgi:hypothetical protein
LARLCKAVQRCADVYQVVSVMDALVALGVTLSLSQIESGWRCAQNRATLARLLDLIKLIFDGVLVLFRSRPSGSLEVWKGRSWFFGSKSLS